MNRFTDGMFHDAAVREVMLLVGAAAAILTLYFALYRPF